MKVLFATLLLSIFVVFTTHSLQPKPKTPVETPEEIFKNQNSFLSYIAVNLDLLSSNYTAYDDNYKSITKSEFLRKVNTGEYMFVKLSSTDTKQYFALYKLNQPQKKLYSDLIHDYVCSYYDNYKWVGKKFPEFSFTDIIGKTYNNKNTIGKVMLIKCWFIGCSTCVKEMPDLNALVKAYNNHNDILFISLAPDSKPKLQAFFKDRHFDYAKVPNEKGFIEKALKVHEYPTHFIVNKQGIIVNVVNNSDEIKYSLSHDL